MRKTLPLLLAATLLVVSVPALPDLLGQEGPPEPADIEATSLGELIEALPRSAGGAAGDYDRAEQFGDGWIDVDEDGCRTRDQVLARDLDDIVWMADRNCTVESGVLTEDPYTGTSVHFQHGPSTSQAVSIDHIVPLHLAWQLGAWRWTLEERIHFANDPDVLLAVTDSANSSKSDQSLAEWLVPDNPSFRCTYIELYLATLVRYDLPAAPGDVAAAAAVAPSCSSSSTGSATLDSLGPAGFFLSSLDLTIGEPARASLSSLRARVTLDTSTHHLYPWSCQIKNGERPMVSAYLGVVRPVRHLTTDALDEALHELVGPSGPYSAAEAGSWWAAREFGRPALDAATVAHRLHAPATALVAEPLMRLVGAVAADGRWTPRALLRKDHFEVVLTNRQWREALMRIVEAPAPAHLHLVLVRLAQPSIEKEISHARSAAHRSA